MFWLDGEQQHWSRQSNLCLLFFKCFVLSLETLHLMDHWEVFPGLPPVSTLDLVFWFSVLIVHMWFLREQDSMECFGSKDFAQNLAWSCFSATLFHQEVFLVFIIVPRRWPLRVVPQRVLLEGKVGGRQSQVFCRCGFWGRKIWPIDLQ